MVALLASILTDEAMAVLLAKMRNVDRRHRVGRLDKEAFTFRHAGDPLARLQHRQRTGDPARIQHAVSAPKGNLWNGIARLRVLVHHVGRHILWRQPASGGRTLS